MPLTVNRLTKEHSWTDRLWSVTPLFYVLQFAAASYSPRLLLLSALVGAWALRLSLNFARKKGYCVGEEDYRWAELQREWRRRGTSGVLYAFLWQTFNILFIACYQNMLLLAITLPSLASLEPQARPLGALDALATLLFLLSFALETGADGQQGSFR